MKPIKGLNSCEQKHALGRYANKQKGSGSALPSVMAWMTPTPIRIGVLSQFHAKLDRPPWRLLLNMVKLKIMYDCHSQL